MNLNLSDIIKIAEYIYKNTIRTSKKEVLQKLYYVSHNFREHFASDLTPLFPIAILKPTYNTLFAVIMGIFFVFVVAIFIYLLYPPFILAIMVIVFFMTFIPKPILEAKFKKLFKDSISAEYQNLIDYSIVSTGINTFILQILLLVLMVIIFLINMLPSFSIMPLLLMSLIAASEGALISYFVFRLFYKIDYYKPLDSILANIFKDNFTNTKTNTHKHAIYIAVITKYGNHKEYEGRVIDIDKYLVIEDKEDRNKRIPIDWDAIESIELVKEK
ncbi:MAG: hypothetical protein QXL94_02665 [Candidatus Parvarchaeum sp.]